MSLVAYAAPEPDDLRETLLSQIQSRTWRRLKDLRVDLEGEHVVLRGMASSFYLKQLAQQSVRDVLPSMGLENRICVDYQLLAGGGICWN